MNTRRLISLAEQGRQHRGWYRRARKSIKQWASIQHNPDEWADRFADLLALFSPRTHVYRSIGHALHYLATGEIKADVLPSVAASVRNYELTGRINGPKTSRFALALKGKRDAVVLDVWMARALRVNQKTFDTKGGYARGERAILRTAAAMGWTPAETQAAIWAATYANFYSGTWPDDMPFHRYDPLWLARTPATC